MKQVIWFLILLSGCKVGEWKGKQEAASSSSNAMDLRMVAPADATKSEGGKLIEIDERTGRPRGTVVVRLDYFPQAQAGQASMPGCYSRLPGDWEIGILRCLEGSNETVKLKISQIDQDCYTGNGARIPAEEPWTLKGCKKAQLLPHRYEPALQVDLEMRDSN